MNSLEFGHEELRLHGLALSCTASTDTKGVSPRHAPRHSGTERGYTWRLSENPAGDSVRRDACGQVEKAPRPGCRN